MKNILTMCRSEDDTEAELCRTALLNFNFRSFKTNVPSKGSLISNTICSLL